MTEEGEYLLKIVCVGSGSVGKTSLIRQYVEGKFSSEYIPTIGIDISTKKTVISDIIGSFKVKLILTDTAGQEFFGSLRPTYYRGASGVIMVFDLTDSSSFDAIEEWQDEVIKHTKKENIEFILVGNKKDLFDKRIISTDEIEKLRLRRNLDYFETSAKTGLNVSTAFKSLVKNILKISEVIREKTILLDVDGELTSKQKELLELLEKKFTSKELLEIYNFLNNLKITSDLSTFLRNLLLKLISLEKQKFNSKIETLLFSLKAKVTILIAQTKELEGSLQVFLDLYVEGLKYYWKAVNLLNIEVQEDYHLLQHILTDFFTFYFRMIIEPIDLDRFKEILKENPEIRAVGYEYGDRFYQFFEQSLVVRSTRSIDEYNNLKAILELIENIFEKKHPHRKMVSDTFKAVTKYMPSVLISKKTIFPDPPIYGENSLITMNLTNITNKRLQFRLDIVSSTDIKEKQILKLSPYEETEVSVALGKIKSTILWVRLEILMKSGKVYKSLYRDHLQMEVGKSDVPLFVHVQAPHEMEKFDEFDEVDLTLFIFNFSPIPIQTKVIAGISWESKLRKYPMKNIKSRKMIQLDVALQVPKSIGKHTIKFQFLDEKDVEIPNTSHLVELVIEETKKRKILRYVKGVGSFVGKAAKIILT